MNGTESERVTPHVLLTGPTGVVGSAIVPIAADKLIALVRRPVPRSGAELLRGDVTQPRFGLDARGYADLCSRVRLVIHSAAVTNVTLPVATLRAVNVEGTRHALELARDAGARFVHVSTVFVRKRVREHAEEKRNAYQESKILAEQLVRDSGLDWQILRPSVVIGDSGSGHIPHFQGFYAAVRALVRGHAPLIPIAATSYVDFLPRDDVAAAIVALAESGLRGEYWITAGRHAYTMQRLVDRCLAHARRIGRSPARPRLVEAEMVDRLILPAFGDDLPADVRKRLELFQNLAAHMVIDEPLPDSREELRGRVAFPPFPDLDTALDRSLAYWSRTALSAARPLPAATP